MPAYAAVATAKGYVIFGDEPLVVNTPKKVSVKSPSFMGSVQEFVSLCNERAIRFFEKENYDGKPRRDSHGKHGRKRTKRLHLPR